MAHGSDFATYVDARWPDLVAGLEDEGVPADDARLAVAQTLVASRRSWARRVRDENVDVVLWADVRERAMLAPRPGSTAPHGVRRFDPRDAPEDWLARAEQERGRSRRRAARRGLVWTAVVATLAAGWLWWAARPEPPPVREEANTLPVVWYAADELHLEDVVVELPDIETFVASGSGAAAVLRSGEVVRIDADGEVTPTDDPPEALADPPVAPRFVAVTQYEVIVQAAPVPGVGWAYLLDSSRRDGVNDSLRRAQIGRRQLVVCRAELECGSAVTIAGTAGSLRLR
jgi:hypothetical protein